MWSMALGSGEPVVERYRSHNHVKLARLVVAALVRVRSQGRKYIAEEVDFGQPIGESICVATGPSDEIVYAQRPRRFGLSRFVKNRKPEPCSSVVVILKKAEDGDYYVLIAAFVGRMAEPEPWDFRNFSMQANPQEAERRAREFWSSHALVWGCEEIVPGTETAVCPW